MQVEGTENQTALSPNTSGDGNAFKGSGDSKPIDTTPGFNSVDFPAILVTVIRPHESSDSGSSITTNNDTANATKPAPIDIKQSPPENSTPVTQSQRSHTISSITSQDNSDSSSSSSLTSQSNSGNSTTPQVPIITQPPTFTTFESSSTSAPEREQSSTSSQSKRYGLQGPDWLSDPFSQHNPALQNYPFDKEVNQGQTPTRIETPKKKKKGNGRKKADKEPEKLDRLILMIDGKLVPLQDFGKPPENETEEQKAERERNEVIVKIEDYHKGNPDSPIPLTKEDIIKIFTYKIIQLQKNNQEQLPNELADSEFVNLLFDQGLDGGNRPYNYEVLDNIGGNRSGEYDGGTLNYIYQGIISAFHGDKKETLEFKIWGYNNVMKPAEIIVNQVHTDWFPYVGKYEDTKAIMNFGNFGYDFYMENFR